jgi:hypothetical protein
MLGSEGYAGRLRTAVTRPAGMYPAFVPVVARGHRQRCGGLERIANALVYRIPYGYSRHRSAPARRACPLSSVGRALPW